MDVHAVLLVGMATLIAALVGDGRSGPAAAEPAAATISVKEIRESLDQAHELFEAGKPGKAAARLAEAAEAIEQVSQQGAAPSGLRSVWERCRSLRNDLELEGADVSGIRLLPLKSAASKASTAKKPAAKTDAKPADAKSGAKSAGGLSAAAEAMKPVPQPAVATPALTFSAQVAPMLSRHCGGCHIAGRKGGFQMVSYSGLMKSGMVQPGAAESSRLVEVILSGDMPPAGGKVSPADLGVLMKWIDAGAGFDGSDPAAPIDAIVRPATAGGRPAVPLKPVVAVKLKAGEVSFSGEVAPVLIEQCTGCHDANRPESGLSMVTLDRLLRGGRDGPPVVSGKAAESLLVKKLKGTGIDGQRMPIGKPPLADDVIAMIERWINQGAKLDLLTPQSELETVAAAGRSQKLSHAELMAVRFRAGSSLWSRAIADEKPVALTRGDVFVVGNLSAARLEELADAAEAVDRDLQEEIRGGKQPLIKGGIVVYGFAKGYDMSSFWETAFSEERPKSLTATAGVFGDVVYAALIPPSGGKPAGEKSAPAHAAADTRVLLTEQMTAAALLGRGTPAWFARAAGRAVAMRAEPKAELVEAWRRELPAALQRSGSPADFFAGQGDVATAAVVGGSFIGSLMQSPSRLESLLAQLDAGTPFDQAFSAVFRGTPQTLLEGWWAQASRGPRR
jgi:hypothetical protein